MNPPRSDAPAAPDAVLKATLDAALEGHALWSPVRGSDGRLVDLVCAYVNPAGTELTGRPVASLIGHRLLARSTDGCNPDVRQVLFEVARTGVAVRGRYPIIGPAGRQLWLEIAATPLPDGLTVSYRDITAEVLLRLEHKEALDALRLLANTDPLTGMANRRAWTESLTGYLQQAANDGRPLTVALLDLDHFKLFNDQRGHPAGDELLVDVAARWKQSLPPDATLARLGGEEFAVALPNTRLDVARKLLIKMCAQVPSGQTSSAGLTVWDGAEDQGSLLGRADAALYAAKHAGRNRVEALLPLPV